MITFELNFEVYCHKCGEELTKQSSVDYVFHGDKRVDIVNVKPCGKCIKEAIEEYKDSLEE